MPDYFDRLVARHIQPVRARAGGGEGRALVRPRLPGPYERVEALRTGEPLPEEPAPLLPTALPRPAAGEGLLVRREREVRTDRHTVVRGEVPAPRSEGEPRVAAAPRATAPPLRPAAPVAPPRSLRSDGARRERRSAERTADGPGPRTTPTAPVAPAVGPTPPAAAPLRPRGADSAVARGPARGAVGRRGGRTAERVVHVQIGRLEVSAAAGPPGPRQAGGPEREARRGPALSLEDYLSRDERRG
ncbi:hypothetical protein ACH429_19680 [Streptomyces pathocidini]|uniref:Uncharacterized protein n=2 Tax=Streptomyces pathocidini TaxID=1650571 RepID=A0ABW7UUL2_9ACTN